jgi:hypothetical protein
MLQKGEIGAWDQLYSRGAQGATTLGDSFDLKVATEMALSAHDQSRLNQGVRLTLGLAIDSAPGIIPLARITVPQPLEEERDHILIEEVKPLEEDLRRLEAP